MDQLLAKLAEVYFETDGSITSALRNVTDVLNKYLLDRNYRAASRGMKAIGYLTQAVFKDDRILYAQCGPSFVYEISSDSLVDLHDPDLSGTGLGVSKSFKVRYHQIDLSPKKVVVLTPQIPDTWNEKLLENLPRLKPTALVQRLLHKMDQDLEAVLLFAVDGSGEAVITEPNWELGVGALELAELDQIEPEEIQTAVSDQEVPDSPIKIAEDTPPSISTESETPPEDLVIPEKIPPKATREQESPVLQKIQPGSLVRDIQKSESWSAIREIGSKLGDIFSRIGRFLLGLLEKMLPEDELLSLPGWTLSLIAVAVPVVMVIFGSYFYIKRGRNQLYEEHLSEAKTLLALAATQQESPEYYQIIRSAFDEIQSARNYQQTDEVEMLFGNIRRELDELDRVTRINYEPLFSRGLGADVTITKMVVTPWNDLYMINGDRGNVIWAQSNPDGYRIVEDFNCGPVEGPLTVGPLVDIVALPASQEDQATILGIDANHTMIFCFADLSEIPVIFEDTSYTLGRGPVQDIAMSSSSPYNLYILDPEKRAIWIEYESQNYHEGSEYFGAIDSPEMADAVELATNGSELFILHKDGYLTKCVTELADSDPLCTTPFEFSDPRPGQEPGPFFSGASFDKFTIKGSPGMAVYLLDSEDLALYRFSTQLEYQGQFRPQEGIMEQGATAFAITMSDRVFLAIDNLIYTAQLLP
jgi:hypothetical protein